MIYHDIYRVAPHSKKVSGLNPKGGTAVFSAWSLNVSPPRGRVGSLRPQIKDMHLEEGGELANWNCPE